MSINEEFGSTQIAVTTVQSMLIILNSVGNSLVCAVILKNQDMRYVEGLYLHPLHMKKNHQCKLWVG